MNGNILQIIKENKNRTQFMKTSETLEKYVFKTHIVDINDLFYMENSQLPSVEIPEKPTKEAIARARALDIIYDLKLKKK